MRKTVIVGLSLTLLAMPIQAEDVTELTSEARTISMNLGKSLKGALMAAMKSGGPVNAVSVCNTQAPVITSSIASSSGWDVARTSLKLRNSGNAPDEWELAVLNKFEERKAAGEDAKKMETAEIVEVNGKKTFRYMKAIPTGKPCMNCHAAEVMPEVEAKLKDLYPADKARGFKPGDIRGAFTLQKIL